MSSNARRTGDSVLLQSLASGARIKDAAARANVSETTVWRRLQEPSFREELDRLKAEALEGVAGALATCSTAAVTTLYALLKARSEMARLGAARAILEFVIRVKEVTEIERRLAAIEETLPPRSRWGA